MRRWLLMGGCVAGLLAPAGAQAATPSGFTVSATANLDGRSASFSAVTAPSHSSAWIAGSVGDAPMLEHWNGRTWSIVTLPGLPKTYRQAGLTGVSAVSPTDVWLTGEYETYLPPSTWTWHQLNYHMTATGWHRLPSVLDRNDPISGFGRIDARSDTDIWAFAYSDCEQRVEHFNGKGWTRMAVNDQCDGDSDYEYGAIAPFASDAALGLGVRVPPDDYPNEGVADCLPRASASCPTQLSMATQTGAAETAAAGGVKSLWVLGWTDPNTPLAYHWNGSAWSDLSPSFGYTAPHEVRGAVLLPGGNLWAVGNRTNASGALRTLILEHTTSGWVDLGGPNVGTGDNSLLQVVHAAGTDSEMWAIGYSGLAAPGQAPLLLHHP